jgi:hypothetical protein
MAFFVVAIALAAFIAPAGADTSTTVTVNFTTQGGGTPTYGLWTTVSGTVSSPGGTPTGSITASEGGTQLSASSVAGDGSYVLTLAFLPAGNHLIQVDYAGGSGFAASGATSLLVVAKADSTTSASGPASVYSGSTADYTVSVSRSPAAPQSPPGATGTVTAHGPTGPAYASAPVVNGTAQISVPASAAGSPVFFDYSGDSNYNPSSVQKTLGGPNKYGLKITVLDTHGCTSDQLVPQNCATPVPGYPIVLGAVFTPAPGSPAAPAGLAPTGTVTFTDVTTNAVLGTSSISPDGIAAIFAAFMTPGGHAVEASYNGDAAFTGAASNLLTIQVINADQIQRYVNWVYLDLLGRDGDPGGIAYWSGLLETGTPRAATSWSLVNSDEFRADVISSMYQQFLERGTDQGGLNYWVGRIGAGMTFEQFQSMLIGSDEYFQKASKGNGDNTTFVKSMYRDVLGREIDPSGQAYFLGLLANGTPRSQVVAAIVYSTEHLQNTVEGYYQHFLGRDSDPGGRDYWVSQLQHGSRDELIIALIIGSDEYFSNT